MSDEKTQETPRETNRHRKRQGDTRIDTTNNRSILRNRETLRGINRYYQKQKDCKRQRQCARQRHSKVQTDKRTGCLKTAVETLKW